MDRALPSTQRSQPKLPDGSQQKLVLLLRLWPRRRCDPLCRTLSPGEVPTSSELAAPLAWLGAFTARGGEFLPRALAPPRRGDCLSAAARTPLAGIDRAHAHRLRAWRLPAGLAPAVGLSVLGLAPSRPGQRCGL